MTTIQLPDIIFSETPFPNAREVQDDVNNLGYLHPAFVHLLEYLPRDTCHFLKPNEEYPMVFTAIPCDMVVNITRKSVIIGNAKEGRVTCIDELTVFQGSPQLRFCDTIEKAALAALEDIKYFTDIYKNPKTPMESKE